MTAPERDTCTRAKLAEAIASALAALRSARPDRVEGAPHPPLAPAPPTFKSALEALLVALAPEDADELMMRMKESRGAFALLGPAASDQPPPTGASAPRARALFVGDACSGTWVALASLGFDVTLMDADADRLGFALERARADAGPCGEACVSAVLAGGSPRLPFQDRAFRLVVQEGGLPTPSAGFAHSSEELRRVAATALFIAADNRFGYKRATGRRGHFVRDPRVLLREALAPSRGERGLRGTRRAVRGPWPFAEAFSLYPHAREFSHVVALDRATPRLTVRRRERKNALKLVGHKLGLFPLLTPSFAVLARRAAGRTLIDRMLDELAERLDEPRPDADVLIATRSNDAIVHTALPRRAPDDPVGRWTLHVPLQAQKARMVAVHHGWLQELRRERPGVPVPDPLFLGELAGVTVSVERRMPGVTGADVTGDRAATMRMFNDAVDAFATLVGPTALPLDGTRFDRLLGARVALAARHVPNDATRRALTRLLDETRERMVGAPMPDAVYHADLRAKHLAVNEDGALLGILDWGASERSFVPYLDVLHLVLHQRKQEEGCSFGAAWELVRAPGRLATHERAALDRYCAAVGLREEIQRGVEALYPALVAGMAERNWDYSRPDWVHRHFGL